MKDTVNEPEVLEWIGSKFRTVLSTADCEGRHAIVEIVSEPNTGPPRHIHQEEDEMFYILSGVLECWVEGETLIKSAGQTAFVARGLDHTYRVVSDQPARFLTIHNPGGFDNFISDIVKNDYQIPGDMAAIVETAARYNCVFTGPPLESVDREDS